MRNTACQLLIARLYLAVTICLILGALQQGEATVTLTAPSSTPCFGQTYKLTCTHPVLEGGILLRWERNGTLFNPPDEDTSTIETTTTLTINVTREEFENIVYTYRCITFDSNLGFINDPNKVNSSEVTVDPPGDLQPIGIQFRTTTLTITVTREEFEKKNYTYRCFIYDGNVGFNDPNRVISNGVTVDPPEPDPVIVLVPLSNSFGCVWKREESWQHGNYTLNTVLYKTEGNEIDSGTFPTPGRDDMPKARDLSASTNYIIKYWAVLDGSSFSNTTMQMATTSKISVEFQKDEELYINDMFTLTCNYTNAYDMTRYKILVFWKKDDVMIQNENSMHLTSRFTGNATYTCGINISLSQEASKYNWTDMSDTPKTVTGLHIERPKSIGLETIIIPIVVIPCCLIVILVMLIIMIIYCKKKSRKSVPKSPSESLSGEVITSKNKDVTPRDAATIVYADIDHNKSKGPESVDNPMINETTYTQIKCDKPKRPEEEHSNQYVHTGPSSENAREEKDPNRQLRKRLVTNFSRESPKDEKALHFSQDFFGPPDE